jgi:hypothetical protein
VVTLKKKSYELFLHNCMLDSRALKNVMPIKFMKILGIETTKPYSKQLGGFIPWP